MKKKGCSIIFYNDQDQILLFLRDDKSDIPFPNMWDLPGGNVEKDEIPEQCIVREMKEEIDLDLHDFKEFKVIDFNDRLEYVFWKKLNMDINKIELTEGQCLKWFTEDKVKQTDLAFGFNRVVQDFFNRKIGL